MNVYFDLNIFDRIEKKETLPESDKLMYAELENLVLTNKITVPYSNAHLNDLFRGFQKNPNYIDGHIETVEKLTKNLCICQYWGQKETTWHYRNLREFFNEKQKEWEFEFESYDDLFDDIPNPYVVYKLIPLPKEWKLAYHHDPLFGIMYPKSKIENTYYSLFEDIFNFQSRLKSDYSLYRTFKSYLIKSMNKLNNNRELLKSLRERFKDLPKHLDIFELSNLYYQNSQSSNNKNYSKLIETFYMYDLKGYKSDKNFNNMFDDSLHTFYGAHCDFFVTNDDRCKYKAEKTYERLKIKTKVIKANEYFVMQQS